MTDSIDIINEDDKKNIIEIIKLIETKTTGKVKIYICKKTKGNPLINSRIQFEKFGFKQLKDKNGVIIFISVQDKKIAIFGDDGINSRVNKDFWQNVINAMIEKFKNGQFALGLIGGLNLLGEKFMEFFMRQTEELSTEVDNENPILFEE